MTGFLKKVFGNADGPASSQSATPPVFAPPPPVQPAAATPHRIAPPPRNGVHQNGKGIELPLQPILGGLPLELQPRLKHADAGSLTISIPLEKILSQLSRGAVKISFGELRQAAPGLFTNETDRDRVWVTLPLAEILPRLNPALIMRRREQKQVEVPEEISSPFDPHGRGLAMQPATAEPEPLRAPTPPPRQPAAAPIAPVAPPNRNNITFSATPPPPAAMPFNQPGISSVPRARQPSAHVPVPAAPTAAPAKRADDSTPLVIGLSALAESWPEAVRKEIVQHNLVEARVELPCEVVERALRQGRIAFTWKTLRSWINPAPHGAGSAEESVVLELPLKIVAPLFLARQQEANATKKKVIVDDDIPNLFFGFPQPESGTAKGPRPGKAGSTKQQDTNYYVWDDASDHVQAQGAEEPRDPSPGTRFVAKYATPNEVVSRAAALDGVAGALIALPDGLMVASRLAPDLNGDTLAAFLPQIFGKVNQCTKELRMGELNNLNFTVGNVPWKIFRVNAIFFAAFGRTAEPLPTAQLAALAAELDHKPK